MIFTILKVIGIILLVVLALTYSAALRTVCAGQVQGCRKL